MGEYRAGNIARKICACAAVSILLCGCGRGVEEPDNMVVIEQEEPALSYKLATVEVGEVVKTERVQCTYRQMNEQAVSFTMSGRLVDRVYVEEGDHVKKGDLLVELSSEELKRQIEDLEYRIARNELLLSHAEMDEAYDISGKWVDYLYYSGMSDKDKENLDNQIANTQRNYRYLREDYSDALEIDRKQLDSLRQEYRLSRVYAEVDGVIYKLRDGLEGTTSQRGETIMKVLDTSECLFQTEIPELAGSFSEGETIPMSLTYSQSDAHYDLMPWNIEEWGDIQLFVLCDVDEDLEIEVGTTGYIWVIADSRENVLRVPEKAIYEADGKAYVYVLGDDEMREVKWVETGLYGDDMVEILSGLTEGERVVLKW
ncbi:MAG: efflux RND transporter periplasmic adaptor subunit [bacterium]|nr:efflux RND transporter periplasmic adaptor subunit [bacterium]MCM1375906.1 efflux RND transporter periplasmic adaptor subunit [Muribaculum sp.]